jgi:hypothetical protein
LRSKSEVAAAWAAHRKARGEEGRPAGARAEKPEAPSPPPATPAGETPQRQSHRPQPGTRRVQRRQRFKSSGVTQQIDVSALKAELGLGSTGEKDAARPAAAAPAEAVPPDEKRKEVALRAFIKRVVPSPAHQRCLDATVRRHLTLVTPRRLAEGTGLREREARRVLDDWRAAGLARATDEEGYQFEFRPSRADLALVREFMVLWADPDWHNRLLGWILGG